MKPLSLKDVEIHGAFWERYTRLVREKVIPYQWEILNDRIPGTARSHCIKNFEIAAGRCADEYYGMVFQDSDLYKWLESVAYSLAARPDPNLEKLADEAIELIGAAQRPDGYINTYYTIKEPNGRWSNLQQGHELYCAGHMIEAAVAYFEATGKRDFLAIAIRFADNIDNTFGPAENQIHGYPGHQVIELALYKLFNVTNERRYLKLAEYFIRQRGTAPNYFDIESEQPAYKEIFPELRTFDRTYSQSHIPPVEQKQAVGHAVRAVYMYCSMAELADELGDEHLKNTCDILYNSIVQSQMYITGAIGASSVGERFTTAYDLPNDLVYGETCAAIGLMMFCRRMNVLHGDARFADTMERALYNTVLAGISLAGTEFYYVNPLEAEPSRIAASPDLKHVKPVRQKWFDCSCCPTNISRTIMGLGGYIYGTSPDGLYVNLYCAGSAKDGLRKITVQTEYPYGDTVIVKAEGGRYKLYLRNPASAPVISVEINGHPEPFASRNGYITLERDWQGDTVRLLLDMRPKLVYTSTAVQNNIGKAAAMRGPLVYCMEQADNGERLGAFMLPHDAALRNSPPPDGLPPETVALETPAYKYIHRPDALYWENPCALQNTSAKLIPYFLWANRGENEMRVYILTEPLLPEIPGKK